MNEVLSPSFSKNLGAALSDRRLELILMPTEKCNFRCVYCYEDFALGKMSAKTIQSIKTLIAARMDRLQHLKIEWFGGEPMLNMPAVLDISRFAKELTATHGCVFSGGMTTNGYLLNPERLGALVDAGIHGYQVSLDGEQADHDRTRVTLAGQGSFEVIWSNLLAVARSDLRFSMTLRVHVTRTNEQRMDAFLERLHAAFGGDDRFRFRVKGVERLGGAHDETPSRASVRQAADRLNGARQLPAHDNAYICYAAKPNAFVIRSDGSVAKCTVAFAAETNRVGQITPTGLTLDVDRLNRWFAGYENLDQAMLGCPAAHMPR